MLKGGINRPPTRRSFPGATRAPPAISLLLMGKPNRHHNRTRIAAFGSPHLRPHGMSSDCSALITCHASSGFQSAGKGRPPSGRPDMNVSALRCAGGTSSYSGDHRKWSSRPPGSERIVSIHRPDARLKPLSIHSPARRYRTTMLTIRFCNSAFSSPVGTTGRRSPVHRISTRFSGTL